MKRIELQEEMSPHNQCCVFGHRLLQQHVPWRVPHCCHYHTSPLIPTYNQLASDQLVISQVSKFHSHGMFVFWIHITFPLLDILSSQGFLRWLRLHRLAGTLLLCLLHKPQVWSTTEVQWIWSNHHQYPILYPLYYSVLFCIICTLFTWAKWCGRTRPWPTMPIMLFEQCFKFSLLIGISLFCFYFLLLNFFFPAILFFLLTILNILLTI